MNLALRFKIKKLSPCLSAISPASIAASFFTEGRSKDNSYLTVHLLSKLKLDWDQTVLALYAQQQGIKG